MKIKKYMKKKQLSHRAFAKQIGVSPATIFHFLNGRTKSLSLPVIQKIIKNTENEITFEDIMEEVKDLSQG